MKARQADSRLRGNDGDGCDELVPPWVTEFLAGLVLTGSVRQAVDEAGIDFETAWDLRRAYPEFAMYWDRALRVHKGVMAGLAVRDAVEAEEARVH
jgi:hypothetical protein